MSYFKKNLWLMLAVFLCCSVMTSCGDDDEESSSIVGKWQKYQRVYEDGSISEGDLDEFWVYNADGTFQNIDGGDVSEVGTYTVSGNTLTISAHADGNYDDSYVITGTFSINNDMMTYTFVYDDYPDEPETLIFKKF